MHFVAQLIYRPDNGEILGVHIFGLHAADLIHEASNAIALGTRVQVTNDEQIARNHHLREFDTNYLNTHGLFCDSNPR